MIVSLKPECPEDEDEDKDDGIEVVGDVINDNNNEMEDVDATAATATDVATSGVHEDEDENVVPVVVTAATAPDVNDCSFSRCVWYTNVGCKMCGPLDVRMVLKGQINAGET